MPNYHHQAASLSGRLRCTLTALTPLFIGGNRLNSELFLTKTVDGRSTPMVLGTTLKGCLRSLAEVVSGSAIPFRCDIDANHGRDMASHGIGIARTLDTVARMFGTLAGEGNQVFAGNILCSDAVLEHADASFIQWTPYKVVVGAPNPKHNAFYPRLTAGNFICIMLAQSPYRQRRSLKREPYALLHRTRSSCLM